MSQFFKITQLKSTIALPQKYKDTMARLGLKKRGSVVFHNITPQQAGMIATVKELVKVELVDEKLSNESLRALRRSNPGFTI
ncbi:hypothetical protein PACTADRAFT_49479, partial [Pachysolen tannophilus NRRL Y-2460]